MHHSSRQSSSAGCIKGFLTGVVVTVILILSMQQIAYLRSTAAVDSITPVMVSKTRNDIDIDFTISIRAWIYI
jgi:hypothetical protein